MIIKFKEDTVYFSKLKMLKRLLNKLDIPDHEVKLQLTQTQFDNCVTLENGQLQPFSDSIFGYKIKVVLTDEEKAELFAQRALAKAELNTNFIVIEK